MLKSLMYNNTDSHQGYLNITGKAIRIEKVHLQFNYGVLNKEGAKSMFNKTFVCFLIVFFTASFSVSADDILEKQQKALNMIEKFARNICGEESDQGSSTSIDVSGKLNVGLNKLFSQIAKLDISGSGAFNNDSYKGVLQKDLAKLLQDRIKCKQKMVEQLHELIPKTPDTSNNSTQSPSVDAESTITGKWNSFFGHVNFTQIDQDCTGTLYYSAEPLKQMGATANIKGKIVDQTMTFVWWVFLDTPDNPTGRGVLTLSNDGNLLNGHFTDKNHPGAISQWQLVRD
jgi:hypothetical protein